MSGSIDRERRRLFAGATITFAAARLSLTATAAAETAKPTKSGAIKPGASTSFASLSKSTPASSTSAMPKPGRPTGRP